MNKTTRDDIKRDVFYRLLDIAGRAFVLVQYSDDVTIGRRGFNSEEKENGIVLVFNNNMRFTWDSTGIHASLVFGGMLEKCFIPSKDIVSIYSPDAKVQLSVDPSHEMEQEDTEDTGKKKVESHHTEHVGEDGKVIKVDFHKRDGHHEPHAPEGGGEDEPA
ncbi:MAG: hypothetical protein GWN86_28125 [Desulfobacterales bacterium]|nr:hypothetical protein [Desulfobacterales bacterium]